MNFNELLDSVGEERTLHPKARRWRDRGKSLQAERVFLKVEREELGHFHGESTIHVCFVDKKNDVIEHDSEPWDAALNADTVRLGLRAEDTTTEALRFAMALKASLAPVEERYGDGYFNAVLTGLARELNTNKKGPLAKILRRLPESRPYDDGRGTTEACRDLILSRFKDVLYDLRHALGYKQAESRKIFFEALVLYLDERFSVSLGRALGLN